MKVVVATFNQEKALVVGSCSLIRDYENRWIVWSSNLQCTTVEMFKVDKFIKPESDRG